MRGVEGVGDAATGAYQACLHLAFSTSGESTLARVVVTDEAAVAVHSADQFGARSVEAGAAVKYLVVVEQLVLLGVKRCSSRRQQVLEVNRQAVTRSRTHYQRTRTFVFPHLGIAPLGHDGIAQFVKARHTNQGVDGLVRVNGHHVASQRVGHPVGVLGAETVKYRRAVQYHDIRRDSAIARDCSLCARCKQHGQYRHAKYKDHEQMIIARYVPGGYCFHIVISLLFWATGSASGGWPTFKKPL